MEHSRSKDNRTFRQHSHRHINIWSPKRSQRHSEVPVSPKNTHPSSSPARRAHDHERKKKKDESFVPFISDLLIACIALQMGGILGCVHRLNLLVQQLGGRTARCWTPALHMEHAQMSPVQLLLAQTPATSAQEAQIQHTRHLFVLAWARSSREPAEKPPTNLPSRLCSHV